MKYGSAKVRERERGALVRSRDPAPVHGFTLVELMVVLVVLGIMAGVTGLAVRSLDDPDPASQRAAAIAEARRRALDTRRPVPLALTGGDTVLRLLALPDGSVRADTALGLNPLTGRPRALP